MHLFITGASGFIGTAVARQLLAAGHTLTGVARSDASAGRLAAAGVAVQRGDLEDVGSLAGAMRNADGIVHIAVGGPRGVTEADERVVAAMIDALAGRDAPLIVTSGVGVYAGIGLPLVDEDTPLDNPIPPQAPRVRLEAQAVAAAARGVRAMVLRPAHAYGAGGCGIFTRMQIDYAARSGAGGYVGDGAVPYGTVHLEDLAAAYDAALQHGRAGARYNIVGQTLSTRDVAGAVADAVGADGRTAALTAAQAQEAWGPLAGVLIAAPRISSLRATRELQWTPRSATLTYELIHGSLRRAQA